MEFDLEALRLIWWALLGVLMAGTVLCEGLVLGASLLLPMLAKTDEEKTRVVAIIAPGGLAGLAWLIVLVVSLFAVWPIVYAVAMVSFYPLLLLVVLASLSLTALLCFMGECQHSVWREYGVRALAWGAALSAGLLGILVGNVLKGVPYHLDSDMHVVFLGDFSGMFNPFSMLVAATCIALLAMHGALYLQSKSSGELQARAKSASLRAAVAFLVLFAVTGLWITHLEGYHVTSELFPGAASNPLAKFVKRGDGLWLDNYEHLPALWVVPVLAFLGVLTALWATWRDRCHWAMMAGSVSVLMVVLTFGVSMFPFLLPSNISLNSSLTIWDSSAGRLTMQILLRVAVFALPGMAVLSRWLFSWQNVGKDATA